MMRDELNARGETMYVRVTEAKKRVAAIHLKPDNTIRRLEEDQRWAKELTHGNRSNLQHGT